MPPRFACSVGSANAVLAVACGRCSLTRCSGIGQRRCLRNSRCLSNQSQADKSCKKARPSAFTRTARVRTIARKMSYARVRKYALSVLRKSRLLAMRRCSVSYENDAWSVRRQPFKTGTALF